MGKLNVHELIREQWKSLIENFHLQSISEKSTPYSYWIENDDCAIEIIVERYLDKFDIRFYNRREAFTYPRSIFSLIEISEAARSKLSPFLLPVVSTNNQYRYWLNGQVRGKSKNLELPSDFVLKLFQIM